MDHSNARRRSIDHRLRMLSTPISSHTFREWARSTSARDGALKICIVKWLPASSNVEQMLITTCARSEARLVSSQEPSISIDKPTCRPKIAGSDAAIAILMRRTTQLSTANIRSDTCQPVVCLCRHTEKREREVSFHHLECTRCLTLR